MGRSGEEVLGGISTSKGLPDVELHSGSALIFTRFVHVYMYLPPRILLGGGCTPFAGNVVYLRSTYRGLGVARMCMGDSRASMWTPGTVLRVEFIWL